MTDHQTTYDDVNADAMAEHAHYGDSYNCDNCHGSLDDGAIRVGKLLLCAVCAYELSKEG